MITKITDRIYIGDWKDASNIEILKKLGINAILNTAIELEETFDDSFVYFKTNFKDGDPFDPSELRAALWFIETMMKDTSKKLLIHCAIGASRSAIILMAYLYEHGFGMDEALEFIQKKRPMVNPTPSSLSSVKEYYKIDITKELEVLG